MKPLHRLYSVLPLCFVIFLSAHAHENDNELLRTEYSYKRYTSHNGLHHLLTTSIFQDERGFLWISTAKGIKLMLVL